MMIYFNSNSTSYPKPGNVIAAVNEYLGEIPYSAHRSGFKSRSVIEECRGKLADFFNVASPEHVIFTSGSTEALNLAIFGMNKPRHIVSTTTEHNSVLRPLKTLERDNGLEITLVDCDNQGFVDPGKIGEAIREDTSALIINHCSNVTGAIQDIEAIAKIAHSHNIPILVDASQSAGAVEIDMQKTGIDMLAFTGHKSLFATTGIGGLVLKPGLELKPMKAGGTGVRSDFLYQPAELPFRYEAGTHNTLGMAALSAGIDYINATGIDYIHNKKAAICQTIIVGLAEMPQVVLYGGTQPERKHPVVNFGIHGITVADISYILNESFGIIVRSGLHCAPLIHNAIQASPEGTVRVSVSHRNTLEEAYLFLDAVSQIVQSAGE